MKRRNLINRTAICLYLVLALVLCVGCTDVEVSQTNNLDHGYKTVEIDGCEYLVKHTYQVGYMAHKGNCKFCKERALAN